MLPSHCACSLNFCVQFSYLQRGRSKKKSVWNDREETVLQEYPIGTRSNRKRGEAPSIFSDTEQTTGFPPNERS